MISKVPFCSSSFPKLKNKNQYNAPPPQSFNQDSFLRGDTRAVQSRKTDVFSPRYSSLAFKGTQSKSSSLVESSPQIAPTSHIAEIITPEKLIEVAGVFYSHAVLSRYADPVTQLTPLQTYGLVKDKKLLALGDLHASIHKLVEVGIVSGLIEMQPGVLQQFIKTADDATFLYLKDYEDDWDKPYNLPKLIEAKNKLDQLIPQMQWRDKNRSLILIGDTLADRACLPDEPTLDLIEHFSQQSPKAFIRIASNHDHSVLQFFRDTDLAAYSRQQSSDTRVYPEQWDKNVYIWSEQCRSLLHSLAIAKVNGTLPALRAKYFNYLKQSKLLYFDDKTNTLFAHAKVKQYHLQELYEFLLDLKASSFVPENQGATITRKKVYPQLEIKNKEELQAFIEQANQAYQKYIADTEAGKATKAEHQAWDKLLIANDDGFLWAKESHWRNSELPGYPVVQALVHGHSSKKHSPYEVLIEGEKAKEFPIFNLDQDIRQGGYVSGYADNPIYIVDFMPQKDK